MTKQPRDKFQKIAHAVTQWIGSPSAVILHTVIFIASFAVVWLRWLPFDRMLLLLTTAVSLEAIYLSLFIQMSVNHQAQSLALVEHDIDEIQEDIDEIQEDVEEMSEELVSDEATPAQ